jgi:hypothetical protein
VLREAAMTLYPFFIYKLDGFLCHIRIGAEDQDSFAGFFIHGSKLGTN